MSPFTQLVKLAGKMPVWKLPDDTEESREKVWRRNYMRAYMRKWRKKTGRH